MSDPTKTGSLLGDVFASIAEIHPERNAEIRAEAEDDRQSLQGIEHRRTALISSEIPLSPGIRQAIASGNFEETRAVSAALAFVAHPRRKFLFLSGNVGVGKTFAAACAIAEAGSGRFTRATGLVRELHPQGFREHRPELRTAALWVVDDLGTEDSAAAKWRESWFDFVDVRQFYGKTIVTTNLSPAELRLRYDERVTDRLRQCATIVLCSGASMRRGDGL